MRRLSRYCLLTTSEFRCIMFSRQGKRAKPVSPRRGEKTKKIMTAEQKRTELLSKLKAAGVKSPASTYPKRDMWSNNTTPDDMFDRMRAHLAQMAEFQAAQNHNSLAATDNVF